MRSGGGETARVVVCGNAICMRGLILSLSELASRSPSSITFESDLLLDENSPVSGAVDVVIACSTCGSLDDSTLFETIQLRYPGARIIAMSSRAHAAELVAALESGAMGYIICGVDDIEVLSRALTRVLSGELAFSNEVSHVMIGALRDASMGREAPTAIAARGWGITDREQHVLALLCDGLTNRQIALSLAISPNTVKNHLANIYQKLGASSRGEAISIAMRIGLT